MLAALTITLSLCLILASTSTSANPSVSSQFARSLIDKRHHSVSTEPKSQSEHLRIADRLLKRVMDLTYETLRDLGASEEDLSAVQHKRNYIQTCYFHAVSCY